MGPLIGAISWSIVFLLAAIVSAYAWLRKKMATAAPVGPQPPKVGGLRKGLSWLRNPTQFLNDTRRELGSDVFLLEVFGVKLFFVFSAAGLDDFYNVPESQASFTEATKGFLGVKVPEEIMSGSMATITRVLRRDFQQLWRAIFAATMAEAIDELGEAGELDVFRWTKQVAHKAGFRSWIGEEAVEEGTFERLVELFDIIDPEVAFTNMGSLLTTILTRRSKERKALYQIVDLLAGIYNKRKERKGDFLEALHDEFAALSPPDRNLQVTCIIMSIHMASQSNLFAAIAWTIVNVASDEAVQSKVMSEIRQTRDEFGSDWITNQKAMSGFTFLEQCYHESIRFAQQSLTLRLVMQPVKIEQYTVVPGYYIATLLSCLNQQETLLRSATQFLPLEHYERGGKLRPDALQKSANEYVISTFGHGPHACPGKLFAIASAKAIVGSLFERFELQVPAKPVKIIPTQMGAVGRPIEPAILRYKARTQ